MNKNTSTARKIINIIVIILVLVLLIQNLSLVSVGFLLFSLKLPLIVIMAGLFIAWWFVSKAFGGEFDYENMKKKYAEMETSLEKVVDKGLEEGKNVADRVKAAASDMKDGGEEVVEKAKGIASEIKDEAQDLAKKGKEAVQDAKKAVNKSTPTRRAPAKKTTTRRAPAKK